MKNSKNDFLSPAKYSSLTKLLKVTAYLKRFIYNCKHPKSERRIGSLLVEEIALPKQNPLSKQNPFLKKLRFSS